MEISGYVLVSTDKKGEKRFLSGNRWVKDYLKLKFSDITLLPRVIDIKKWPNIGPTYFNAQIKIDICI